ncbi:hypothetical protein M9H77_21424 [Catharanthus roseus]|uniref:Uncharacterized protein n=1 Tax=Catharanthus roseus TaxID=4058 RepID=A0ACC0ARK3_CATRO|nr:hypothetical protein M9H77_21424 [Catharanthus roseus]
MVPLIFTLSALICSSYVNAAEADNIHSSSKHKVHEISSRLLSEITVHGFLLWASFGFLMPIALLVMRTSKKEECGRRLKILVYTHATLQILSVLLITIGAVMSVKNFDNSFSNEHQRLGLALYGFVWLQILIGIFRPVRGSKGRSIWYFVHWLLGTAVSLLGIINIYTGLRAYHRKTSRSTRIWTIIFTAEISVIILFYLIQEKWDYIRRQGVILGHEPVQPTEQEISPRNKLKETVGEPC